MAGFISFLRRFTAPALPQGPEEYERGFVDKYSSILRLYFNQIDNALSALLGDAGGKFLRFPYGAFSSYVSQSATANTATLLLFEIEDFSSGIHLSSSKMVVTNAGIYNMQFSVQVQNLDNAPEDMYIWLRQNGVDIPGSTGKIGLPPRKDPADPSHDIKGWNYFLSMNANDYVEIYWSVENPLVTIETYAASGTPTKPSTASVVATMTFVSAI